MTRDAELDFAYDISKSYLEKISQSLKKEAKRKASKIGLWFNSRRYIKFFNEKNGY